MERHVHDDGVVKRALACLILTVAVAGSAVLLAQQVLDRVVARVGTTPIMLTDLTAARALGIVEAPEGAAGEGEALTRMIERQLALGELAKFPSPEPDRTLVDAEVARMTAVAGAGLPGILQAAGLDERRLRDLARNTVRLRVYLDDKFPPGPATDADVRRYYATRPEEFTRNGAVIPFEDAQPAARAAVAEVARRLRIARWIETLRSRVEVVILKSG